jgi:HD superfamily phosphodiesterase
VLTRKTLETIKSYPRNKIEKVVQAIEEHSFSSGLPYSSKETMILHYANKLESSGAILIMRGFASTGVMSKMLIHPTDPFSRSRKLDDLKYALNLYIARCLKMPHCYTPKPQKN